MTDQLNRLKTALADRYSIERELGSGGMATVYLAEDLKHHRQVAIKVLRPELAASLGVERFVREIEIAANLTHPHILALFDSGEAGGFLYYVMPFIEGESLRERIDREGKLDIKEAIRLTDQVASALSHAHERGLVHRDIKPENILLTGDQAIVADFGIARAVEVAGGERLTGTGLAVGTPAYMSPEQAVGDENIDARSDVYALGCVVYEMVSGGAPFEGATPQEMLAKHAVDTAPSLRTSDPSIPLFVERAVDRALAKSRADRFQSASEFADALTSEIVVARVGRRRWPRRSVAATVIGVLLVAAWWLSTLLGGPAYERLAVLPPANLANDSEQEHIIQGMLNGLISELGQAGITIIGSVQSMMRYQDTEMTVREIAAEMGVDAVIESTVLWVGDSVAIGVRLTDGRTEESLWSQSYDEDARNVLALYRQVTGAVADEIQLTLTPQAEARLASAREVDPQAYEDYLRGQFHFQRATPSDLDAALEYFERALRRDSTYALAYTGISLVWAGRAVLGIVSSREALVQRRAAVQKALALDSNLGEVQWAAASLREHEWDWAGAETAYRRAFELNPNYAEGRAFYSHFLSNMGRPEEARAQMDGAVALDPSNGLFRALSGELFVLERRYEDAIAEFGRARELGNQFGGLWNALYLNGAEVEAFAELRKAWAEDQELLDGLDRGYAEGGYRAACRRGAEIRAARGAGAYEVASWYASARDEEHTLEWLERGYEEHGALMSYAGVDPLLDFVRDEPRFQDLLRRMNLPP
jgi:serine/threonine-protein kinase